MSPLTQPSLPEPEAEFDLAALSARAGALLARMGTPADAQDGRVRGAPDGRTIRYYQSLGLVDRPSRYEGRQAVYGYRHLLQCITVKLLQAEGLSLAQVQVALQGAATAQLEDAVRGALRAGSATSPSPPTSPAPANAAPPPRELLAFVIAPGVHLNVDLERAGLAPRAARKLASRLAGLLDPARRPPPTDAVTPSETNTATDRHDEHEPGSPRA